MQEYTISRGGCVKDLTAPGRLRRYTGDVRG
jgi:hypothetical protein